MELPVLCDTITAFHIAIFQESCSEGRDPHHPQMAERKRGINVTKATRLEPWSTLFAQGPLPSGGSQKKLTSFSHSTRQLGSHGPKMQREQHSHDRE